MANPLAPRIRLFLGDITTLDCDAIVTAANAALRGGGGVDGAVHRAAGPDLVRASMAQAPCPAGEARVTPGFRLSARFVIHAVGPIFRDMTEDKKTLAQTYESSLSLAAQHNVTSIAFPCISTGVYGFPADAACEIAIDTVLDWLRSNDKPDVVTFCCFSQQDHTRYKKRLGELGLAESES
ncbi:O-acetyl-ADP-ribose deacetylase [Novipirellula caenicola]|uniref:O-acetyl-ADP-ribose deacetylase n=1 Tax=Novipirellula caenicola TaxID=1536901 RepID=A0ABP9VXX9_9BACT